MTTIGILWPGAMGSALGRAWQAVDTTLVTTIAGRSERTRELAATLTLLGSVDEVVAASDAVVSVVPRRWPSTRLPRSPRPRTALAAGRSSPTSTPSPP